MIPSTKITKIQIESISEIPVIEQYFGPVRNFQTALTQQSVSLRIGHVQNGAVIIWDAPGKLIFGVLGRKLVIPDGTALIIQFDEVFTGP
jgi:hypothetical protein